MSQTEAAVNFESFDLSKLPTEQAVNSLIDHVVALGASDMFIAPGEETTEIHMRHLGMVKKVAQLESEQGKRFSTHIKVLAGMEIDEHRRPLEGRWVRQRAGGNGKVDLRINTIPTLYGEDYAVRILYRRAELAGFDQLGLLPQQLQLLKSMLNSPSGLILVTGPTASGKTTTLYTCLEYLNNGRRKINTIEDPIEYPISGIRQSQVNTRLGVDFPDLLRSVLRQAPDVIMIGEIRDAVTARTAVRAAASGHLVLATAFAPVASAAVQSMLAYEVHPYLLSTSLRGVIAQRLVRSLKPECREPVGMEPPDEMFAEIQDLLPPGQEPKLYAAKGTIECPDGYGALNGIFEVMNVSKSVRDVVAATATAKETENAAKKDGFISFRQASLMKIASGETTTEEILRVVPAEFMGADQ
ncbi:MAG: Flp pilus assembly complex ATPase component TadA [Pirellulales bacterium]|nr:Flp pilus assembly complex ATPase component TadA [Pirellulales bacterium]